MGTTTPGPDDLVDSGTRRPRTWLVGLVEAAASLTALFAITALLANKADATIGLLGTAPVVTKGNVTTYHDWLPVLLAAVVTTFVAALYRKGPSSRWLYWHGLVLTAGLFSAVAFHVALPAPPSDRIPVHQPAGPVCRSGGDNRECVGG